jgi:hypothetical protein
MVKVGARLGCPQCPTEVVVTRATEASAVLACSGSGLVGLEEDRPQGGHAEAAAEPAQLGKRYVDDEGGLELLCTKPGAGQLSCDGRPVSLKSAKPLPSSD